VSVLTWAIPPRKEPPAAHYPDAYAPWVPTDDPATRFSLWQQLISEARDGIERVVNSKKLVVSALRGFVPTGAGMVLSLIADVSVASETVEIADRHIEGGVAAGDGIVLWSLLCGMQRAKYYALTCEALTGREAERIGLVSLAVPEDEVLPTALRIARQFAHGPQHALSFTKRAFNQWSRLGALSSLDVGLYLEMLNFLADQDVIAVRTKPDYRGQGELPVGQPQRVTYPSVSRPYGPRTPY
jgi:enoyl-CoA hydratase